MNIAIVATKCQTLNCVTCNQLLPYARSTYWFLLIYFFHVLVCSLGDFSAHFFERKIGPHAISRTYFRCIFFFLFHIFFLHSLLEAKKTHVRIKYVLVALLRYSDQSFNVVAVAVVNRIAVFEVVFVICSFSSWNHKYICVTRILAADYLKCFFRCSNSLSNIVSVFTTFHPFYSFFPSNSNSLGEMSQKLIYK